MTPTEHIAKLREALENIAAGEINCDFVMSNPPDWHTAFGNLQHIARKALALPTPPEPPQPREITDEMVDRTAKAMALLRCHPTKLTQAMIDGQKRNARAALQAALGVKP